MTTTPEAGCGCPEFRLSRRRLLAGATAAAGTAMAGSLLGGAFRQVAYGAQPGGNTLVVLSLRGGADGLSIVVPRLAEDRAVLARLRPGIAVPDAALIGGDSAFGLHPALAPLLPRWRDGSFGAVHAVGLPMPNRSHFDAINVVEDADPGSVERVGWINRLVGLDPVARPETAVQLGGSMLPTSLVGPAPALGAGRVRELVLPELDRGPAARLRSMQTLWAGADDALGVSMRATLATTARLAPLAQAAGRSEGSPVHLEAYPRGPLREVLADTAALIRADLGTRVVTVDYGNWDMHTGLAEGDSDPTRGWMADQLTHLAGSLAAFLDDLGPAASRVTVVTLSEFGRRVRQNGHRGVDHGYGNAMLLLGAGVRGGRVHGRWPGLTDLDDGDLRTTTDYRSVLWEVLSSRFADVGGGRARVFPGFVPETVGAMA